MFNQQNKNPNAIQTNHYIWFIVICKIFDLLKVKKRHHFWSCFLSFFYMDHSMQLQKGG